MFERALALDPGSVEAQSLLASALATRMLNGVTDSEAADLARAEGLVNQALAASPPQPDCAYGQRRRASGAGPLRRGHCRIRDGARDQSQQHRYFGFSRGLQVVEGIDGGCHPAPSSRRSDSVRAIPDWVIFCFRIGHAQLLQSRTDEALLSLERARRAVPELPFPHALLASTYGLKGEAERAAAELAEARRLSNYQRYMSTAQVKAFVVWQGRRRRSANSPKSRFSRAAPGRHAEGMTAPPRVPQQRDFYSKRVAVAAAQAVLIN